MNENINLVEILKDCPKGTILWSKVHGPVEFQGIVDSPICPISTYYYTGKSTYDASFTKEGSIDPHFKGECLLVPSKDQQDWSKFKVKKLKFDPKTFKPFDKVLARMISDDVWVCDFFSHIHPDEEHCVSVGSWVYNEMIPYNEETKHLIGTTKEAPEYYRYWEE